MKTGEELRKSLLSIDGRGYKSYKMLEGEYKFSNYVLAIDYVQGDPFASPSRIRIVMDQRDAKFSKELFDGNNKKIATQDFLTRLFYKNINTYSKSVFGSGKSGLISISRCPQEMLDRTSVIIDENSINVRIEVGFPARGRSVLAKELEKILFDFMPMIINNTLVYKNIDNNKLKNRIKLVEDQEAIRNGLSEKGLIAFVANGSILPRESGISTKPLRDGIPFYSPKSMEVSFNLPNRGEIKGMGIPKGISLIVGGGYHGKSTLLQALELGVYNHIEDDGREFVIVDETAMKVRAEDGRVIHDTDISLFINNLPNKKDTRKFTTENASGSTSQAGNIIEGIESGTKLFLIDEDTSATNFMIRDDVMQSLVSREKEPITPFIEVVKSLYEQKEISTIIVVGSSGDFFDIADNVIQMDEYEPKDVTSKAKELSTGKILERVNKRDIKIKIDFNRIIKKGSMEGGPRGIKIKTMGKDGLSINKDNIDLRAVEQLVDNEQVTAIGYIMKWAEENKINNKLTLIQLTDEVIKYIDKNGLVSITGRSGRGNLAMPRRQEIMGAFNRYRRLKL